MDPRILLEACLKEMAEKNASDLHLKSNAVPRARVAGHIVKLEKDTLSPDTVYAIADCMMGEYHKAIFKRARGVDLAYTSPLYGRFRANVFYQMNTVSIVIRAIKSVIPQFHELAIPPVFERIAMAERGLILLAGATSSGKTTTVAALVDYINEHCDEHIVTIEDPIEFVHQDKRCLINQREIGQDADSFPEALKYVVRQDPDVIVIGEMRDPESFQSAIAASETGHLVISTIHAKNVHQVFDRIVGFFPSELREQVLVQLSFNVQAISCQRLLRRSDGTGLIPAFEIMTANATIAKLIRENKLDKISQAIVNCNEEGMQTFNQSLCKLHNDGIISKEEALIGSDNPQALEMNMKGIFLDDSSGGILER